MRQPLLFLTMFIFSMSLLGQGGIPIDEHELSPDPNSIMVTDANGVSVWITRAAFEAALPSDADGVVQNFYVSNKGELILEVLNPDNTVTTYTGPDMDDYDNTDDQTLTLTSSSTQSTYSTETYTLDIEDGNQVLFTDRFDQNLWVQGFQDNYIYYDANDVGIGDIPTYNLDVQHDSTSIIRVKTTSDSDYAALFVQNDTGKNLNVLNSGSTRTGTQFGIPRADNQFVYSNNTLTLGTLGTGSLILGVNDSKDFEIKDGGKVVIPGLSAGGTVTADLTGQLSVTPSIDFTNWDTDVTDDVTSYNDLTDLPSTGDFSYWVKNAQNHLGFTGPRYGLGTLTPLVGLHMLLNTATARFESTNSTSYSSFELENDAGKRLALLIRGSGSSAVQFGHSVANFSMMYANDPLLVGTTSADPVYFGTNNLTRMELTASGNLVLGSATDSDNLINYGRYIGLFEGKENLLFTTSASHVVGGTGENNIIFGEDAGGYDFTTAKSNILFNGGENLTSGSNNVIGGASAAIAMTTGNYNVALGSFASRNSNGSFNTSLGFQAGDYQNGVHNINIGRQTGTGTSAATNTGSYNTWLGYLAGQNIQNGNYNTGLGEKSLNLLESGVSNVALGRRALEDLVSGSYNLALGNYAGQGETGSYKLHIGGVSGQSLIYGEFDNQVLDLNADVTVSETLTLEDKVYIEDSDFVFTPSTHTILATNFGSGDEVQRVGIKNAAAYKRSSNMTLNNSTAVIDWNSEIFDYTDQVSESAGIITSETGYHTVTVTVEITSSMIGDVIVDFYKSGALLKRYYQERQIGDNTMTFTFNELINPTFEIRIGAVGGGTKLLTGAQINVDQKTFSS